MDRYFLENRWGGGVCGQRAAGRSRAVVDVLLLLLLAPVPLAYRALRARPRLGAHHHTLTVLGEVAERSRHYGESAAA
jgi:hypothetical protein